MENRENLDLVAAYAIRRDIGRVRDEEFARARYPSGPAQMWEVGQSLDRSDNARSDAVGGGGTVARHEIADRLEIRQRRARC